MSRKIILYGVLAVVVALCLGMAFLVLKPVNKIAASTIKVESTPEKIARGKYLFEVVSGCSDCHSEVDYTRFGSPVVPGRLAVGKKFPAEAGLPGTLVSPNLTPDPDTGSGQWTDGQIIRSIREGIGHDERVLFPFMPYPEYSHMSDEDVQSVVAYLRSLPPVKNPLPRSDIQFPVGLMIKSLPKPVGSVSVNKNDRLEYGRYLARIAGCQFCHTPVNHEQPIAGREFSGGHVFQMTPTAHSVSANLTPDAQTGIGTWTDKQFVDKFYQYRDYVEKGSPVIEPARNTVMPWLGLCRMEEDDLKAIFAYLKTVPPVSNAITTHPDAPEEKSLKKASQ